MSVAVVKNQTRRAPAHRQQLAFLLQGLRNNHATHRVARLFMSRPCCYLDCRWLCRVVACLLAWASLQALAGHAIEAQAPGAQLKGQIRYQIDDTGQRQLQDVRSPAGEAAFSDFPQPVRSGRDNRPYWLRISLEQTGENGDWVLSLPTTGIQDLEFFGPFDAAGNALAAPVRTGLAHAYSSRPLKSERYAFRARLPAAGQYTAYLKMVSQTSQRYEIAASETSAFLADRQDKRLFDGVTYGILLALLVYNLVLTFVFRDSTYLLYVMACAFALLTIASFNGHAARYLFPDLPLLIERSYVLAPSLWILCSALFGRSFLDLPRLAPVFNWLAWLAVGLSALSLVLGLAGQVALAQNANEVVSLGAVVMFLLCGLMVLAGGYRPALWYLAGQAMLFFAVMAVVMVNWGWLDSPFMVTNGLQLGIVMEMVVFGAALSSRIRTMRERQVELQLSAGRLAKAAHSDPLTGLVNRAGLGVRARQLLAQTGPHSLMLLDLDRFKPVNDEFGHQAGDEVLMAVAQRIAALLRGPDTVARLGGDEFVILVEGTADRALLSALANRLQAAIQEPIVFKGVDLQVGSSLGIALCPEHGRSLADLLQAADEAMYAAKQGGRGRFRFFDAAPAPEPQTA